MRKSLLFAFFLLMISCAVYASAESTTVMVYMCGSNLETLYSAATTDVQEIQNSGLDSSQTQVYFMAGGSKNWNHNTIGGDQGGVYTLTKKTHGDGVNLKTLEKGLSDMNMGEQSTLAWFLNYCREHSQTDRYALILWDHGGGPVTGVCWDEQYRGDHLTLDELTGALAASPFAEKKLSWIGFDACLMSSVEVASKMAPYAEYMIASQAEEPGSGWNYAFLNGLENDRDGGDTGKRVIESYFSVSYNASPDLTMACIDLSKIGAIEESMDTMYQGMTAQLNLDTFSSIAKLRQTATGFGKSVEYQRSSSGYDLVDVVSLSACYADKNPEGAESVRQAVADAMVYSRSNISDCNGLSVYHPFRNQKRFLTEWSEAYKKLDFCPGYTSYVDAYGKIMTGKHLVRWNDLTDIQTLEDGSLITLHITAEQAANLASARLVVLARNIYDSIDDAYFRMFSTSDVRMEGSLLSASYSGTALQIMTETGSEPITGAVSYRVTEDGTYLVNLYPVEEDLSRHEIPIIAEFVMNAHQRLELKGYLVFDEMTGSYSRRAEVDLSQYRGITFLNEYRVPQANSAGEYLSFDEWPLDAHKDKQWKARYDILNTKFMMSIEKLEMVSEELYAAYEITDTQGNVYMTELVPLDNGGTNEYPVEIEIGKEIPDVSASMIISWASRALTLELPLTNRSDNEQIYNFHSLSFNGIKTEHNFYIFGGTGDNVYKGVNFLRPGETGKLTVHLEKEYLQNLDLGQVLQGVTGEIWVYENGDTSSSYEFEFKLDTMIPLDELLYASGNAGKPDETIDLTVTAPTVSGFPLESLFNVSAYTRGGSYETISRIIVNITVKNVTDADLELTVDNVSVNGIPLSNLYALSGREAVAPGETATANLIMRYEDIAALMPDVSLRDIRCTFLLDHLTQTDGEETRQYLSYTPITLKMDVSLTDFYGDTDALPAQKLFDLRERYGAFSETNPAVLYEYGAYTLSLEGIFGVERSCVLLLKMENHADNKVHFSLGQAELDGRAAIIGKEESAIIGIRNSRVNAFGLDKEMWDAPVGVLTILAPGEEQYCYVMVKPASEDIQEAYTLSFHAYLVGVLEKKLDTAYSDAIEISAAAPMRFEQGKQWMMPSSAFVIKEGSTVPPNQDPIPFAATIMAPAPDTVLPMVLELTPLEGDQIQEAKYVILRRIRSDREMAEMNIKNGTSDETDLAEISFADGREWMMLTAGGDLYPAEDGHSASGVFYGLYPAIVSGEEAMPLIVQLSEDEAGKSIYFSQFEGIGFSSATFPSMTINETIYGISLTYDLQTGAAKLLDFQHRYEGYDCLIELVDQFIPFLPVDSTPEELLRFLTTAEGLDEYEQTQSLRLSRPELQLAIHSIGNPDDYYVVFGYLNQDKEVIYLPPRLLSDFVD